jgi:quercetin dioxygenase-like cupin family protein
MPAESPTLFRWSDIELDKVTEMVSRKELRGDRESLVQTYFKKGALVPRHEHNGPQWIYVLQGGLLLTVGGQVITAREGDVVYVPAGAPHQAEAIDDTFVLDIRRT